MSMKQNNITKGAGNLKVVLSLFVLGFLMAGAAVMYGRMDTGVINVSATISTANQESQARGEDASAQVNQPSSDYLRSLPNGGLVGTGKSEPTPPPVETGTSTGTTTDSVATTTPEGTDSQSGVGRDEEGTSTGTSDTTTSQTEPVSPSASENATE